MPASLLALRNHKILEKPFFCSRRFHAARKQGAAHSHAQGKKRKRTVRCQFVHKITALQFLDPHLLEVINRVDETILAKDVVVYKEVNRR